MSDRRQEMLKIVDDLYASTGRGDWEAAEAYLTDDFFVSEGSHLPFAGRYEGRDALARLYQIVIPLLKVESLDIAETVTGEDYAVTILELKLADGHGTVRIAELFRFRGDKVCEIRPYYFDPAPVWSAARANGFKG